MVNPGNLTCLACRLRFTSSDTHSQLLREHYNSDWHRFNLHARLSSKPPITLEEYNLHFSKGSSQDKLMTGVDEEHHEHLYCTYCKKSFNTRNTFNNHIVSKKHKEAEKKFLTQGKDEENSDKSDTGSFVKVQATAEEPKGKEKFTLVDANDNDSDMETHSEIEEIDSDEWDECRGDETESLIDVTDCLFCGHHSKNMLNNLKHMTEKHSFFIPDVEYCTDVRNLLLHLGEKISQYFICLWCNEKGRTFDSMQAVRLHMIDKGHCRMYYEGEALAEFIDYYDYSSSYPDNEENKESDEIVNADILDDVGYQLTLPSGKVIGHRSLLRYYKQNQTQNNLPVVRKADKKLHKVLGVYRALGWSRKEQEAAVRTARDVHFLKRIQSRLQMQLSLKANKFQKHYRPQVNF